MTDMIIGLIIGVVGTIITMGLGLIGGIYISHRLQQRGSIFSKKTKEKSDSPWKKIKTNTSSTQNNTGTSSKTPRSSKSSISSTTKSINTD